MSKVYRGPSIDASYQVSVQKFSSVQVSVQKTDDGCQMMAKAHIAFGKVS